LPNVGPYIYMTLAFLALLGAPYIYDISSLRVKVSKHIKFEYTPHAHKNFYFETWVCAPWIYWSLLVRTSYKGRHEY